MKTAAGWWINEGRYTTCYEWYSLSISALMKAGTVQKRLGVGMFRRIIHLEDVSSFNDFSCIHDVESVADLGCEREIMCNQESRKAKFLLFRLQKIDKLSLY